MPVELLQLQPQGKMVAFTVECREMEHFGEWRDFAVAHMEGQGAATPLDESSLPPQNYRDWVQQTFKANDLPMARMRYWVSVIPAQPESYPPAWSKGFPHTHGWDGWTLVLYLSQIESGGELVVRDDKGTVLGILPPKLGTAVFIDGRTEHGVMIPYGEVPRVSLIATGYSE